MCEIEGHELFIIIIYAYMYSYSSLGSRPSPYVRVLIARGVGKSKLGEGCAWDDSSREA